jgi:hypothetical protein
MFTFFKESFMRRSIAVIVGTSLFLLIYLTGCEKSSPMPTQPSASTPVAQQDQTAMASIIAQDPLFTTDATALNDGDPSLAKTDTAIAAHNWGRKIQSVSRDVAYDQVDDSTVIATVTNTLTGQVWIRVKSSPRDTIIYKPLNETIVHKVEFSQVPVPGFAQLHNWRMVAVSGAVGGTTNGGITIQNVTFFIGNDTVSVTSPLDSLFQIGHRNVHWGMREFEQNPAMPFSMMVTVRSIDPDSDIVVAHRPVYNFGIFGYHRAPMMLVSSVSNGDGTFTRVYESTWQGCAVGRFEAMVSAITRQSVYDDQAAFSSQVWGIPYIVDQN